MGSSEGSSAARRLAFAIAAGAVLAACSPAKPPPRSGGVITRPDWSAMPSGDDVARFYPKEAMEAEIGGRVMMTCAVTTRGSLEGCAVVSEDPPGNDFGAAALHMTKLFRMKPMTRDGKAVGGAQVNIPIHFIPPPPEPTATAPAAEPATE